MLGISFSEIILTTIIALLVFGPEQLAGIVKNIGLLFVTIKRYFNNVQHEFYTAIGDDKINNTRNELINTYYSIKNSITIQQKIEDYRGVVQESISLYQPELEFNKQPELFD